MSSFIISTTRVLLFAIVATSAIVSLYSAMNAVAVYTDHSSFTGGMLMIVAGVAINPLFCYVATYGLVRYLNMPLWEAMAITLPACLAWCVAATRTLLGSAAR